MYALAITAPDTAPMMAAVTTIPTSPIVETCIKDVPKKAPSAATLAQDNIPIAAPAAQLHLYALAGVGAA